jgi:hypothetical protein
LATTQGGAGEHAGKMLEEAKALRATASEKVDEIRESIRNFDAPGKVSAHPIAFVAGAFGVGYVLGGGIFSGTTGWLVKNGLRAAAIVPVAKMLFASPQAVTTSRQAATPPPPKRRRRRSRTPSTEG